MAILLGEGGNRHNETYWLLVTGLLFSGVCRFSLSLFSLGLRMVLLLLANSTPVYRTARDRKSIWI
jgi:hypothetical protein